MLKIKIFFYFKLWINKICKKILYTFTPRIWKPVIYVDILKIEKVQDQFWKFMGFKQFNTDKNIQNYALISLKKKK